jgi:hypothetical protein
MTTQSGRAATETATGSATKLHEISRKEQTSPESGVRSRESWVVGRELFRAAVVLAAWIALPGCVADPEHTNRFDPEAPIELQAGATLTGRVRLERVASAAGVSVALADGSGSATTESDGAFKLSDIRPGTHSLVISRDGYRQVTTADYELAVGEVKDVGTIELMRGRGLITGTVEYPAGAVAVPVTVTLRGEGVAEDTGTGADGAFSFPEVPVGVYTITARGEGFVATCGDSVEVKADKETVQVSALKLLSAAARVWLQTKEGEKVEYTNQTELDLSLAEVDITAFREFRYGTSHDLSASAYAAIVTPVAVTLEGDDGGKQVYVQFKDRCGNETEIYSTPEVTLDRQLPSGKVKIDGGATYLTTEGGTAVLDIVASDTRSPVVEMQITIDGVARAWEAYAVTADVTFDTTAPGTKTISVVFRDEAGNESAAATDDIIFDNVAPENPSIVIGDNSGKSNRADVVLTLSADGAIEMKISNQSGMADASWRTFLPVTTWTLQSGDGDRAVYAAFRDAAGNETAELSASVTVDQTAPTGARISVAGGSEVIMLPSGPVSVTVEATGAYDFQIANDPNFEGVSWETIDGSQKDTTITLTSGEGLKQVYARFRDDFGNITAPIFDTVFVDDTPPAGARIAIGEGKLTGDASVDLVLTALDAAKMWIDGDVSDTAETKEWIDYQSGLTVTLTDPAGGNETKAVTAKFQDAEGNESETATATIVFDNAAPSGLSMTLSGTIADGASSSSLTSNPTTKVSVTASDPLGIEMAVSAESLTCADAGYVPFSTTATVTLTGTDGDKTVYACFRDEAGNVTQSPTMASITLDTTAPTGGGVSIANGASVIMQSATANPVAVRVTATNAAEYQVSTDPGFAGATWTKMDASPAATTVTLANSEGEQFVFARFRDAAGNEAGPVYDFVAVDGQPPEAAALWIREGDLTSSAAVTLQLEAADAAQMYIGGDVTDTAETMEWVTYSSSQQVTLTSPAGGSELKTITAKFRDVAGNEVEATSAKITYDNTAPSGASISLEGELAGKEGERQKSTSITAYPFVTATLAATDALDIQVAISESSLTCSSASYEPMITTRPVVLSATDGTKTVYACFKDKAGNYTSSPVSDSITLDMTVPSSPSIAIENLSDTGWTKEYQAVQVTLSATDAAQMRLGFWLEGNPNVKREFPFELYAASDTIPLTMIDGGPAVDGRYHVWAEFKDTANNVSPRIETIVMLDTTPPASTTIQIGDGSEYTNNQVLTVGILPGQETGFHSRIASMRAYPSTAGGPGSWTEFAPVTTVSLPNCPAEDCYHTIKVDLADEAGNETLGAAEASVYLDTMVPAAPNLEPPKYLITSESSITLGAGFPSRGEGIVCDKNFKRFEMSGETNPGPDYTDCNTIFGCQCDPSDPINNPVQFVYQLAPNQQNVLRVRAVDEAGNVSQDTFAVVTQDSTPPLAPEITRSEPEDGSVFLEWASPAADADISAYLLYYGSASGSYNGTEANEGVSPIIVPAGTIECSGGSGTCFGGSFRLTGTKNATDLYVAVSALDRVQPDPLEGSKSVEVRIQPNKLNPTLVARIQSVHRRMQTADRYLLAVTGDGVEAFDLNDGPDLMGYKGGVFFETADTTDLAVDLPRKKLYVAAGESGVAVIDLGNLIQNGQLQQADRKALFRVPGTAVRRVAFMTADNGQKSLVFAAGDNGLYVVDATDESGMSVVWGAMAGTEITAVEAVDDAYGRHLFVANSLYGLAPFIVDTDGSLVPDVPEFYQPKDWGYCSAGCPAADILVSRDRVIAVDRTMGLVNMDRAKLVEYASTYSETGLLLSYAALNSGPHMMNSPDGMAALPDDADGRRRFAILGQVPNQEYGKIEIWKYLDPTSPPSDKDKLVCDKGCASSLPDLVTLKAEGGGILFDANGGGRHADNWIVASRQALGFEIFEYDPAQVPSWIATDPEVDPTEDVPGDSRRIVLSGDLVLLADGSNGFIVVDAAMPANLKVAGRIPAADLDAAPPVPDGRPKALAIASAGPAALVGGTFGLVVVDLTKARDGDDQTKVAAADVKATVLADKRINQIEVSGSRAYAWEYTAALTHLLHVFDISDVLQGAYANFDEGTDLEISRLVQTEGASGGGMNFDPWAFAAKGDFVFLVRNSLVPGQAPPDIMALDLSDLGNVKEAKASTLSGGIATSIRVEKDHAYITDRKFGLLVYDLGPLVAAADNPPPPPVTLTLSHMMPVAGSPATVAAETQLAFIGTRGGISIADVAQASGSVPVSDVAVPYEIRHMVVDGQTLWVAAGEGGLLQYALARPARTAPLETKVLSQGGEAGGVALLGDWLFALNTYDAAPGLFFGWKLEQYYARNLKALSSSAFNDEPDFPTEPFIGVGQVVVRDGSLYLVQYRSPHRESCSGDPDCPQGFKCVLGTCSYQESCNADADCPQPGFRCQESPNPPKKCVYAPAGRCGHSADCAAGLMCKDPDTIASTGEPYVDVNANGRCDTGIDTFADLNGNLQCDGDEPWTDSNGNGTWDEAEWYTDANGNRKFDPGELFTDLNLNNAYDEGEPLTDLDGDSECDGGETFTDLNGDTLCQGGEAYSDDNTNGHYDHAEPFTDLSTCGSGRAFRVVRAGVDHDGTPHAFMATDWIAPPRGLNQTLAPVMHVGDMRVTLGLSGISANENREIGQVLEIDLNDPLLLRKDRVVARHDLTPDKTYWIPAMSGVERFGKYLYVLAGRDLLIFDTLPFDLAGKKTVWRVGEQMLRAGDVLFVSSQESQQVRAYSLLDPTDPVLIVKANTTSAGRLYLSGNYLFTGSVRTLANGTRVGGGFQVFNVETILDGDVSTAATFEPVVFVNSGSNEIAASGPYLMLANQNGIQMFEMR